jgi:molybdate transport system substrate-binding protein
MGGRRTFAACLLGMLWVFPGALPGGAAQSAELVIITGQGTTPEVKEVAAAFASKGGNKITVVQEDGPALDQRLAAGAPADLIASSPVQIADLVKRGKVVADSVTPFRMAGLGLSVRAGLPKPDISTVEAYKAALLAAKSVGYSKGCSGTNAADGIEKLGLAEQLKAKTVFTTNGPVVDYLARGDIDLGIQQTNIMVGVPGTEYVGALPGFLNKPCPASLALMAGSKEIEAARALMRFMLSSEAAPLLRKTFVEPMKS